jgi:ribonuclease P protein component
LCIGKKRSAARRGVTLNQVRSASFPKPLHLRTPREFAAVYDAKVRESRGPLLIYALPNGLNHPRIGLSTSRKVGTAVRRNRIRRLLREAFRLMQHDLPRGYDLVVVVRPHEPLMLADYQKILSGAVVKLHNLWQKRPTPKAKASPPSPGNPGEGRGEDSSK